MNIHEFTALPHRFRWGGVGGDDCMTFPASWALQAIGLDPADGLRGTYTTRAEAQAIVDAHGGALAFMGSKLLAIGARRTDQPADGDIGLVRMLAGDTPDDVSMRAVGAIRFGPLWASLAPAGVVATRAECIAAWRLPT